MVVDEVDGKNNDQQQKDDTHNIHMILWLNEKGWQSNTHVE